MLDGRYTINANTPMGAKTGTLSLASSDTALAARIKVPGLGTYEASGRALGDEFQFAGSIKVFLLGKIDYEVTGRVEGDALRATCKTSKGRINVTGTRVS